VKVPGSARQRDVLVAGILVVGCEFAVLDGAPISMVTALALGALALRRRHPQPVLVAIVLACTGDALLGGALLQQVLALVAVGLAAWTVGATARRPPAAALVLALSTLALSVANQVAAPGAYPLWNDVVFFTLALAGPALAGRGMAERAGQLHELTDRMRTLERQRADEQRAARLGEQARVEAGVQRAVLQRMGAIALQAAGAERAAATDPGKARAALAAVETSARSALEELRYVLGSLRVPEPEPPQGEPDLPVPRPARIGPLDLAVGAFGLLIATEAVASASNSGYDWANLLAALGLTVPLIWRRRWPVVALVASELAALVMASFLTPPDALVTTLVPVLLAAFAVTAYATGPRRVVGLCVLGLGALAMSRVAGAGDGFVPTLSASAVAAVIGWAWSGRTSRIARLAALEEKLVAGAQAAARLAAAERRHAIARELHDVVAHALTVVCLHSAGARQAGSGEAAAAARTMGEVTRDAMEQLRRAVQDLESDDAEAGGFDPAALVATARASGIRVRLSVSGQPRPVSSPVARTAERSLQEALTNAARHAPGAEVEVTVCWEADAVVLDVQDRRPGGDVAPLTIGIGTGTGSGTGLVGLRERARGRGGTLEAGPTDVGFGVRVRLPLDGAAP
jgi:signal transduction histidine kinase